MSEVQPSRSERESGGYDPGVDDKPDYAAMAAQIRDLTAAFRRIAPAVIRVRFALLDQQLAETPAEDRPAVSWEVEREDFLRQLGDGGSHDDPR